MLPLGYVSYSPARNGAGVEIALVLERRTSSRWRTQNIHGGCMDADLAHSVARQGAKRRVEERH